MSDLPPGWAYTAIEAVAAQRKNAIKAGPFGSALKKEYYVPSGFKIYGQEQVLRGDAKYGDYYISRERYETLRSCAVGSRDILMSLVGTIGRALILPDDAEPGIINPRLVKITLDERAMLPEYFTYLLQSPSTRASLKLAAHGGTMDVINLTILRQLKLPLPPRAEQERIVAAIEEHFSRLDAGVAALERAQQNLKRMRVAVLQAAISGRLIPPDYDAPSLASDLHPSAVIQSDEDLPPNWVTTSTGSLGHVTSGATPLRSNEKYWRDGSIPWVTSTLVNEETITAAREYITPLALKETSVKLMPRGTLLVAMYGEGQTRGRCSELLIEATTNQACAAIVIDKEWQFVKPFLKLVLTASYEKNRRLSSGGVQPNLSVGIIKRLVVPLPPKREQVRICAEVDSRLLLIDQVDTVVKHALIRANYLRAATLATAFSGGLVPQDPADEPASRLLQRIGAERASSNGHRPRARRTPRVLQEETTA